MKAVTVKELKAELAHRSPQELLALCLRLSKFKKENKELLTYVLFESTDEEGYVSTIKREMDEQFELINTKTDYFIKKSIRKILRHTKTSIRYSQNKETEIQLLIYFCVKLRNFTPSLRHNNVLRNLQLREITSIKKKIAVLHEDLQFDYQNELEAAHF